jgi:hypothetical protein
MSNHSDNYNPRIGIRGRVNKDDFSIDGKSWEYRNPDNFNDGQDRASDKPTYNRDAYSMTNPLYDYSYGQIRDAAKELGIGNVDEQAEVDQLLKYMQEKPAKKNKDKDKPKAQDFKDEYVNKIIKETKPELSQTVGDVSGGDNSIVSPINQDNDIDIAGDGNKVSQDNSIAQMMDNMKQSLRFAY